MGHPTGIYLTISTPALRYIVEVGRLECTKDGQLIKEYMDGEYFGERALLEKEPRAATGNTYYPPHLFALIPPRGWCTHAWGIEC